MLATAAGLGRNGLADTLRATTGGPTRLAVRFGSVLNRSLAWAGAHRGTTPTLPDRLAQARLQHHLITSAHGFPLAVTATSSHRHDVTQLIPLVDAISPIRGRRGAAHRTVR